MQSSPPSSRRFHHTLPYNISQILATRISKVHKSNQIANTSTARAEPAYHSQSTVTYVQCQRAWLASDESMIEASSSSNSCFSKLQHDALLIVLPTPMTFDPSPHQRRATVYFSDCRHTIAFAQQTSRLSR